MAKRIDIIVPPTPEPRPAPPGRLRAAAETSWPSWNRWVCCAAAKKRRCPPPPWSARCGSAGADGRADRAGTPNWRAWTGNPAPAGRSAAGRRQAGRRGLVARRRRCLDEERAKLAEPNGAGQAGRAARQNRRTVIERPAHHQIGRLLPASRQSPHGMLESLASPLARLHENNSANNKNAKGCLPMYVLMALLLITGYLLHRL